MTDTGADATDRDVQDADAPDRDVQDTDALARGMRTRRAVLGDAHVDRAVAATTPLTADFQDLLTRYAWGDVWSRPGPDLRTRRLVTVALLAGLGHHDELEMHLRRTLAESDDVDDVREVLLHVALYAGLPAANHAFATAARLLAEQTPAPTPDA